MSCGCVQIYYGVVLATDKSDKSYKISNNGLWALPEVGTGLLVACLPVLPKFSGFLGKTQTVSRIGTSIRGLLGRSYSGGSGGRSGVNVDVATIGQIRVRQPNSGNPDIELDELIETRNGTKAGDKEPSIAEVSVEDGGMNASSSRFAEAIDIPQTEAQLR